MRKSNKLLIIALLIAISGIAQVAKDDILNMNKVYQTHTRFSFNVLYEVYKNRTAVTAVSTERGVIKRKDALRYMKVGNIESIDNPTYHLIVDHDDKNISVLGIKTTEPSTNQSPVDLEKILKLCTKVEFKKISDTQNSYDLLLPVGEYSEVKVFYNAKTFFVEKMILYYSEKENLDGKGDGLKEFPRMEITYSDINLDPNFGNTPFSYDAYLEKHKGKLTAKAAFKTYTVNEQLFD